jgi:hypothetical protein
VRSFWERDGLGAFGCGSLDLRGRLLRVPERDQDHRNEPFGRLGAPLVEDEVIPRLDTLARQLLVGGLIERLAGEAGEGREAQLRLDAVGVHVLDSLLDVPAAGDHVVEADRVDPECLLRLAGDGVEPNGRVVAALEPPELLLADMLITERVDRGSLDLGDIRTGLLVVRRQPVLPHGRVLDDVVVNGDDVSIGREHRRRLLGQGSGFGFS